MGALRIRWLCWAIFPVAMLGVIGLITDRSIDRIHGTSRTIGPAPSLFAPDTDGDLWASPGHLLLAIVIGALIATAFLEFSKRLTPLRGSFHRFVVETWFGHELALAADRRPRKRPDATDGGHALYLRHSASVDVLAVQISGVLRTRAERSVDPADAERDDDSTADDGDSGEVTAPFDGLLPKEISMQLLATPERADAAIESWIDAFVIDTTERWLLCLRIQACILAGFGAVVALPGTISRHPWTSLAVLVGGVAIGGPLSWLIRDGWRVVSRRASA